MEKINKNGRRNPNVAGVVVFLFFRFCWYSVSVDNHANIMWIACGGINRGEHLRIPHLHEPRKMSSLLFFLFFLSCTSKFNHPYTILFPFEPLEVFEITDSSTKKIHQLPFPVLGEEAILRVFFFSLLSLFVSLGERDAPVGKCRLVRPPTNRTVSGEGWYLIPNASWNVKRTVYSTVTYF